MEDEDEIKHSIEQSSMAEPHQKEEPQGSNQCGTVLTDVESFSPVKTTLENVEELKFEQLTGVDEEAISEGGANVEGTNSVVVEDGIGGEEIVALGGGLKVEEVEVKDEMRTNEGDNVEESKLEGSKMEENATMGYDGTNIYEVVSLGMVDEGHIEGENVKELKLEDSKMEEKVTIDDYGMDMDEVEVVSSEVVVEEGIKEEENVKGSKSEEVEIGLIKEGVIEDEKPDNENGNEQNVEVNVNKKEEEEGRGEDMEDSEATADEEVSRQSPVVEEDADVSNEEESPIAETEMETESEVAKSGSGSGGKRRRGRIPKASTPVKASSRKTVGEDVCFICLDGGELVLCDRRACPKAYHPSCVDHDAEFFKSKGRWNCGWHLCNKCQKNAYFYCYTCTFSSCKGCSTDASFYCVRGSKGFCESCLQTILMIESNERDETGQSAFDDESSWEYLFKDYWFEQKGKLSITSDELAQAEKQLKDYNLTDKQQTEVELHEATNDVGIDSDNSPAKIDVIDSKRKRPKRKSKPVDSDTDDSSEKEVTPARRKNNRRSKSKVKESSSDSENSSGNIGTTSKKGKKVRRLSKSRSKAGPTSSNDVEWASEELMEFVMHMKNGDRSVLTPFDVQSLLLEYITKNKLRDPRRQSQILCDSMLQKLFGKPRVGHIEMLKLLEMHFLSKEDSHVVNNQGNIIDTEISELDGDDHTDQYMDSGKSRGKKSRKRGEDRVQSNLEDYAAIDMHNINLIYLRRCLMESLMDDTETFHDKVVGCFVRIRISGSNQKQDIYRLVQIIGTSKAPEPYKVGKKTTDVMLEILNLDKTEIIAIDTISNQEFTEDECKRLRQSIKCGLISRMTVGDVLDKARELQEVRVTNWLEAEVVRLGHLRDRASDLGRKRELRECVEKLQLLKTPEERQRRLEQLPEVHSDPKMDPSCESDDENESLDTPRRREKDTRPRESGFVRRGRDNYSSRHGSSVSNDSWSGNARPPNKTWEPTRNSSSKGFSNRRDDNNSPSHTSEHGWGNGVDKGTPRSNSGEKSRVVQDTPVITRAEQSGTRSDLSVAVPLESSQSLSSPTGQTDVKVNDTEKAWHYRDPTSKVQGPFSMSQLRKWSNTGYFPSDLRIWRTTQTEDDSILLTEALAGRFQKEFRSTPPSRFDSSSLPSPTPSLNPSALSGKQASGSFQLTNQFQGNERLPSPTPTSPSNLSHQPKSDLIGNKHASQIGSGQFVSNSTPINPQQMSSQQPVAQPFIRPDATLNQTNVGPSGSGNGQGFSNTGQTNTGQNPAVYPQNWGTGFAPRPEMVNTNLNPNNALPMQVAYNPWTGIPVNNQAQPFGTGFPPPQGNIVSNFPNMQVPSAWRPPTQANIPWGAQQQPVNQNVGWAGPHMAQPTPTGPGTVGWMGSGPNPSSTNTNMVWVGAPGTTGTWGGGDQNRNGGGGQGGQGGQRNRQSSFGSGGQRVCKYFREHGNCRKGSSCDYKHT